MPFDFSVPTTNQTSRLQPHPLNDKIYGRPEPGKDFLESIKKYGILNPIIVTKNKEIISGTRRWLAAKKLELKSVPVMILRSQKENFDLQAELFLIESNRSRIKSEGQIAREANELLRIESELAKQRQIRTSENRVKAISPEQEGQARDKVANTLGIGAKKVDQAVAVVRAADKGDRIAKQELKKLDKDETTVNAAYRAIQKTERKKQKSEHQKLAQELQKLFGKKAEVQASKEGKFNVFFYKIDEAEVKRIAKAV